jgi:hypothetical protein
MNFLPELSYRYDYGSVIESRSYPNLTVPLPFGPYPKLAPEHFQPNRLERAPHAVGGNRFCTRFGLLLVLAANGNNNTCRCLWLGESQWYMVVVGCFKNSCSSACSSEKHFKNSCSSEKTPSDISSPPGKIQTAEIYTGTNNSTSESQLLQQSLQRL